jgi:hypothetical protein
MRQSRLAGGLAEQMSRRSWLGDRLVACLCFVWLAAPTPSFAYRPFVSTDAAVADPGQLEIETGVSFERQDGSTAWVVPRAVFNYGLFSDWEAVAEFALRERSEGGLDIVDGALSLKGVLKPGVLQNRPGVSVATEMSLLLPSSAREERNVGAEGIAIVSGAWGPFTVHLNGGLGAERSTGDLVGIWGAIAEAPVGEGVRLVGEVEGEQPSRLDPRRTVLLGLIWQPWSSRNVWLDAGVRRGLTNASPDWQFTVGVTFDLSAGALAGPASHGGSIRAARW